MAAVMNLEAEAPCPYISDIRELLAIVVSKGKANEVLGVQLTHEQVKRLSDKNVQKYYERYAVFFFRFPFGIKLFSN
jgi:hypothetical protein